MPRRSSEAGGSIAMSMLAARLGRGDERVVTQACSGCFRDSDPQRNEFLRAISHSDLK